MLPYSTQCLGEDDYDAVDRVLRSPYLTSGPEIVEFEKDLKETVTAAHVIAVSSATAGLHLAMLALGVGPGDLVLVSNVSFVSSANCAKMAGADVDFIDVDPKTGLITPETLESALKKAESSNRKVKAVVAVHLSGRPLELRKISSLKEKYGFYLIEDAAHALGAVFEGVPIGSCTFSDLCVFSFHPVKIITTAEGGAVTTQNDILAHKIRLLRSHGIVHDKNELLDKGRPPYYYEMQTLGFNYRLSDIQAALGRSQLKKLPLFLKTRRELAARYFELLLPYTKSYDLTLPPPDCKDNVSSWHLYQIGVPKRDGIYTQLREAGLGVQVHYLPISRQPYYGSFGTVGADSFYERTLSIPLHVKVTADIQKEVVKLLIDALDKALT